jgi:dolichol-phosphate mannosyltransferase
MKISVVIPVYNEAENVGPLAREIQTALHSFEPYEIIFVDDGSTDDTSLMLERVRGETGAPLRILRHARRSGQSMGLLTGIRAARAEWVATLDGDGQNDPADIPVLMASVIEAAGAGQTDLKLVTGNRTTRRDTWLRRASSRIANGVRARLLHDGTPDTGCGLKVLHRETFLGLPHFDHMHRFLPALFQTAGARAISIPVRHRPRIRGTSKYGLHNRLWAGIIDLLGVQWLIRRATPRVDVTER